MGLRRTLDHKIITKIRKQYPSYLSSRDQPREVVGSQIKAYLESSDKERKKRTKKIKRSLNSEQEGAYYPENLDETV
jgi:hypothetical protein